MTHPKIEAALAIGDRLVLWIGLLGLIWLMAWQVREADTNSPTLIAPVCVDVPATRKP